MTHLNGNIPSINNSQFLSQSEVEKAKQNMNSTASQNKILGADLTSNTSVPTLNSSVGTKELQDVKNIIQINNSSNKMF